jgi:hypothetical protein
LRWSLNSAGALVSAVKPSVRDTNSTPLRRGEKAPLRIPGYRFVEIGAIESPARSFPAALFFCRAARNAGINDLFPKKYRSISIG